MAEINVPIPMIIYAAKLLPSSIADPFDNSVLQMQAL
jgi:hypothetical protein